MLYRLEVENFYSIRDQQVIDLSIAPNVPDLESRFAPIFPGSEVRAPKVVAIYGANASGKTTLLRAFEFLIHFAKQSAMRGDTGFSCGRFNDAESSSRPIKLAIEFGGPMNLSKAVLEQAGDGSGVEYGTYRYELEIEVVGGSPQKVLIEALRQRPQGQGKWQRVFERDSDRKVKDSRSFSIKGFHHLLNTLRPNASVISSFGLFQHPASEAWIKLASNTLVQIAPIEKLEDQQMINLFGNNADLLLDLNKELGRIDVGVEAMRFEQDGNVVVPLFKHSGLQIEMPWILQSHGTQSFIKTFPFITVALSNGGICAIDELDASIHPMVLPEIIGWFYGKNQKNKKQAQLWFTCHSVSLLEQLCKEEVILCEKDRKGRTSAYSLMDVKVRRDENLYRKYLSGAYGGVPQIG